MARIDLVDLAHSYGGNDVPPESFALKPVTMTWRPRYASRVSMVTCVGCQPSGSWTDWR